MNARLQRFGQFLFTLLLIWSGAACTERLPPTAVVVPVPTFTATPMKGGLPPLLTPVMTPAPDITSTVIARSPPQTDTSYPSPDQQWLAKVVIYPCVEIGEANQNANVEMKLLYAYEALSLVRMDKASAIPIAKQLRRCGGLGGYGLKGLFWSPNSLYFYYTDAGEGVPDGCGYWARPLLRFDTQSQKSEQLGGGLRSPDGKKIVTWAGTEVVVWEVDGGEMARKPAIMPNLGSGPIVWSPDSQALVYLQLTTPCPPAGKSYGVRLTLRALEQTLLFISEKPTFRYVSWEVADHLLLGDENSKRWSYNFATQQIEPSSP